MNRRSGPTNLHQFQFQLALGHTCFVSSGGGGCLAAVPQGPHVMGVSRVLDIDSLQCLLKGYPSCGQFSTNGERRPWRV